MKHKKASIVDIIFIAATILMFAVGILITFKIIDEFNTELQSSDIIARFDTGSNARDSVANVKNVYTGVLDNSFLLLMVGLSIGALALAFMVRIHPVFFVFFIIIFIIIIVLATVFSNIYLEMANNPELEPLAEQLIFTTSLMKMLPFVIGVVGFLMSIIMYKTWSESQ